MFSFLGCSFKQYICPKINRSKSCRIPTLPKNFVPVIKPKHSDLLPSPLILRITDASTNVTISDIEESDFSISPVKQGICPFEVIKEISPKRVRYSQKTVSQSATKTKHSILSMLKVKRKYSQQ